MDPLFAGLPCNSGEDCINSVCDEGLCRCTQDAECGGDGSGFVCAPPPTGTPGTGNACRAEWLGSINGVRVYHDSLDRWVGSRHIWNQHAYSITNVNENGTIPQTSLAQKNWQVPGLNNFRQNIQGDLHPEHSPDLTTGQGSYDHDCINGTMILHTRICNRGTNPIAAGIKVGFFVGEPDTNSTSVCNPEAVTESNLDIGKCEVINCTWPSADETPGDMTVVVDYDNQRSECLEGNNRGIILNPHCQPL
jgi:CARDB.